jgi:hypothetical protein
VGTLGLLKKMAHIYFHQINLKEVIGLSEH